ncbi:MAG: TIGR02452 family protein [Lachnospiraceae bacterium]|nr:TIGR02452 family protein [Lachnospiraceae bacterium]
MSDVTIDKDKLIAIFRDTMKQIESDSYLKEQTDLSKRNTRLYLDRYQYGYYPVKNDQVDVEVLEDTSFHCASQYVGKGDKVAVLNFANSTRAGGRVMHGSSAQEESLCRSSNLYPLLDVPYLEYHFYKRNHRYDAGIEATDAVIYTPDVVVFKDDQDYPEPLEKPFQVDVLSSATPDNRYKAFSIASLDPDELKDIFVHRIRNLLEVAVAQDIDILILGAYGCGASMNQPEIVANAFQRLLYDENYGKCFKKILFPIKIGDEKKKHKRNIKNLEVFKEALEK